MNKPTNGGWSAEESLVHYRVDAWGHGFFGITDGGHLTVRLRDRTSGHETHASIAQTLEDIRAESPDFELPVLFRFPSILRDRIEELHTAFETEIGNAGYGGRYRGVYPVKVNQEQQVVREITEIGQDYHYGLEVGTKPELLAALAYLRDPEALLICNGYKDDEFIELALIGQRLGLRVFLVIETARELEGIMKVATRLDIEPNLGIRVKLFTKSSGLWKESGGEQSPFGLNFPQLVACVDMLKEQNSLHWLRLLHYHQGSQVPEIRDIETAVHEAAQIYACLVQEGAPMGYFDCGGGLAVDYDGTGTNSPSSKNYTLQEYCRALIKAIQRVTKESNIPPPDIVTESGRAIVAYYSILVFNILDVTKLDPEAPPDSGFVDLNATVAELRDLVRVVDTSAPDQLYESARGLHGHSRELFVQGKISIREKAFADEVYWYLTRRLIDRIESEGGTAPDGLNVASSRMVDYYYGNFSIFQSLPDSWALHQVFPVMPIHRLDEEPTREAIISDITCDCDGLLDEFAGTDQYPVRTHLRLHDIEKGASSDYYLGVFLVGAYQETLGDLHNLLGDTNIVSVTAENGRVSHEIKLEGDTISEVLSYLEYDEEELSSKFRALVSEEIREGRLLNRELQTMVSLYEKILQGYTYYARWKN